MRLTTLFLILFFIHACKEESHEKEYVFEFNKSMISSLDSGFHLGGGLCVAKSGSTSPWYGDGWPEQAIHIYSCYDSLSPDTMPPKENIIKYRQGGLCFFNDCSIKPEKSFTVFMMTPRNFIGSCCSYRIFASRHSNSAMLYKRSIDVQFPSKEELEYMDAQLKYILGESKKKPKPLKVTPKEISPLVFFKEYDEFWGELFSIAKPLNIKDEGFSNQCNSKFCSTKDILEPLYEIRCSYGMKSMFFECLYPGHRTSSIRPKCFEKLEKLSNLIPWSKEHGLLMHSGTFPAGDCDLGNWRYIKIDSLGGEHREKLKSLLMPPDSVQLYEPGS